jgi:uncharacterized protein YndB with AHSA1/START domain
MKVLKIIGIVVLAIIVIVGAVILMQPAKGHVEKSIVINAPPSTVYRELNSFKSFKNWSPWAKMDPAANYVFEGPESGVGAKMSWDGKDVGKGSQVIEESVANQKVRNSLAFDGYDGKAYADFILVPEGDGTKLTWTYDGTNDGFAGKTMWLFMGGMMDGWYTQGLNDIKTYVESLEPPTDATIMK